MQLLLLLFMRAHAVYLVVINNIVKVLVDNKNELLIAVSTRLDNLKSPELRSVPTYRAGRFLYG